MFALAVVRLGNASEAYRVVYSSNGTQRTTNSEACRLLADPRIAARVDELKEQAVKELKLTVADLVSELEEARNVGKQEGLAGAMVSATMGKAKLLGLDKDPGESDATPPVSVTVNVADARKPDA